MLLYCRPTFKNLQNISSDLPSVPVMALTATAPPDTLDKLKQCFSDALVAKGSIDRPNISLCARRSRYGRQIPQSVTSGKTSAG